MRSSVRSQEDVLLRLAVNAEDGAPLSTDGIEINSSETGDLVRAIVESLVSALPPKPGFSIDTMKVFAGRTDLKKRGFVSLASLGLHDGDTLIVSPSPLAKHVPCNVPVSTSTIAEVECASLPAPKESPSATEPDPSIEKETPPDESYLKLPSVSVDLSGVHEAARIQDSDAGLPLLPACVAGCGFRGQLSRRSLCSACWKRLANVEKHIDAPELLTFLLARANFRDEAEARTALAEQKLEIKRSEETGVTCTEGPSAGIKPWSTQKRPLTQYDKVPMDGKAACSFVAVAAAMQFAAHGALPVPDSWAASIRYGVRAFHKACSQSEDFRCTTNPLDAVPFVSRQLAAHAMPIITWEETAVLLHEHYENVSQGDVRACSGHSAELPVGKDGLIAYVRTLFNSGRYEGVVVVRPPESYSLFLAPSGKAFFRDSHRRAQIDFTCFASLIDWLTQDTSYFQPFAKLPAQTNVVGFFRAVASREASASGAQSEVESTCSSNSDDGAGVQALSADTADGPSRSESCHREERQIEDEKVTSSLVQERDILKNELRQTNEVVDAMRVKMKSKCIALIETNALDFVGIAFRAWFSFNSALKMERHMKDRLAVFEDSITEHHHATVSLMKLVQEQRAQ